jgi:hypothetical protein
MSVGLPTTSRTLESTTMKGREAKDQGKDVADTRAKVEGRDDFEAEAGVEAEAGAKAKGRVGVEANIEVEAKVAGVTEEGAVEVETSMTEGERDPAREMMRKYLTALKRRTVGNKKKKKKRRFLSLPTSWGMLLRSMPIRTHFVSPPFGASDDRIRLDPLRVLELHKNTRLHQQLITNGSMRSMVDSTGLTSMSLQSLALQNHF